MTQAKSGRELQSRFGKNKRNIYVQKSTVVLDHGSQPCKTLNHLFNNILDVDIIRFHTDLILLWPYLVRSLIFLYCSFYFLSCPRGNGSVLSCILSTKWEQDTTGKYKGKGISLLLDSLPNFVRLYMILTAIHYGLENNIKVYILGDSL